MEAISNEKPKMSKSTSQKTLPPIPFGDEDTQNNTSKIDKSLEQTSPNALRELDILLRESTPEGEHNKEVYWIINYWSDTLRDTNSNVSLFKYINNLSDSEEDSLDDDDFDFNQITFDEVDGNILNWILNI